MKEGFSEFPSYVEQSSKKPKLLLIFGVLFLIVILLVVAGLFFLGARNKKEAVKSMISLPTQVMTPTPTSTTSASLTPSVTPGKTTPTPTKAVGKTTTLDRSKLKLAVLNGSGTPGAAKGISSYLNGLGYTIATIGNADKFDYKNITVYIKKSKSDYLTQLKQDIASSSSSATIASSVDDTIATDAEVIVGK